ANMSTVCDANFCIALNKLGAMGVLHRAASDEVICAEISKVAKECEWVAASIGVGDGQKNLLDKMIKTGVNIVFLDIAHGYSDNAISFGQFIKNKYSHVKLVMGNAVNENMVKEIYEFA